MPSRQPRAHHTHGRACTTVRLLGRFALIAGLTAATAGTCLAAQPNFPNPAIPVKGASDVAIADFNSDGIPDAAIGSYNPGGVVIALGRGDGTLVEAASFPLEQGVIFVDVVDINRDSRQDLILTNNPFMPGYGAAWVILGRGDGTFQEPLKLTMGGFPNALAVGDFDEDGNLDLASIVGCSDDPDCASGEVWVARGHGDGTFGPATGMVAGREPIFLVSGDFNEDGHRDLMVANTRAYYPEGPGDLSFLAGRGDGTFAPEQDVAIAVVGPHQIAVGDFNADGHADLAGINNFAHSVAIYTGRGDGTFFEWSAYETGERPSDIAIGDFNGDGLQDVATANSQSDDLAVLPGRGDGTFGPAISTSAANGPGGLGFADFDRDHLVDVVIANGISGTALLLKGHGDGTFGTPQRDLPGFYHWGFALEDFDQDGLEDLLVSNGDPYTPSSGGLTLMRGAGNGTFGPEIRFGAGANRGPLATADFNEDGIPDFAVGDFDTSQVSIFLGLGDGTFGPDTRVTAGLNPGQVASGDLNGDGHVDLAVVNLGANYPTRVPADISVLLGRGDGTFAPEVRLSPVAYPVRVAIADLDGDRKGDLVVTSEADVFDNAPGYLSIFFSRGNWTFSSGQVLVAGQGAYDVVAADFNGDGVTDLVADNRGVILSEFDGGDLSLYLGLGAGSFEAGRRIATGGSPVSLSKVDLNLDGKIDLVTANSSEDATVLFGRGDGTFEPPERFGILDYPSGILTEDLNFDGLADLVSVGQAQLVVLLNQMEPPGNPPLAYIDAPLFVECIGPFGALVTLDGTRSFDPDVLPGGSNGIVKFEWVENLGPGETPIGTGPIITVALSLARHEIGLRVTDETGAIGEGVVPVTVLDTIAPTLSIVADPTVLWPPNRRLVPVHIAAAIGDACDLQPSLRFVSVISSEPDDAPGDRDGRTTGDIAPAYPGDPPPEILLRAERDGDGPGRTYEIIYAATDASGNTTPAIAVISVPHDQGQGPEPLSLRAEPAGADGSTRLFWNSVNEAQAYDLISGDLASLRMEAGRVSLGAVRVLGRMIQGTSWSETDAAPNPPAGQAFFYLVEYRDARGPTGFGAESVPLPREPSACDSACPGREAEYLASAKGEPRKR